MSKQGINISKARFMSQEEFDNVNNTSDEELYLVDYTPASKYTEVIFPSITVNNYYISNLPKELPDNLSNIFCNVYAKVKSNVQNFKTGDIIPISSFWGANYRSFSYWFNKTQCGFSASDQLSCNNKQTANGAVNITTSLEIHFDFYKFG